ncbi:hypothetical protein K4F52_002818 [Lecanicillium sp. MT-2017a]|nr:hypothetical protein K4F52_002818 [Lecanicillium sp. MT-2017a]
MGAVLSCIQAVFRTIGSVIMTIVNAVGTVLKAIIDGVVAFFGIIVNCLTCGKMGGRRRRTTSHV